MTPSITLALCLVGLAYLVVAVLFVLGNSAPGYPPSGRVVARSILWPLMLLRCVVVEAYRIVRHG